MKCAIIYASIHNGNTRKVVEAIGENCQVDIINATQSGDIDYSQYEMIGFASGIYMFKMHKSVVNIAKKILNGKQKVFLIYTCGNPLINYDKEMKELFIQKGCEYCGKYVCRGYDTYGPLKAIGGIGKNHPNENEINKAIKFVRERI